jgi:hypothetical protein
MLLLRSGVAQGVPSIATIFMIYCASPSGFESFLIPPPEISDSKQRQLAAKQGETWREMIWILPTKYLFYAPKGSVTCRKILWHRADGFTPPTPSPEMKTCCGIFCPRPGLNTRILDKMASTIITRPPRMITWNITQKGSNNHTFHSMF